MLNCENKMPVLFFIHFELIGETGQIKHLCVGKTGVGKMGVGKMGQIIGEMEIGKMRVGEMEKESSEYSHWSLMNYRLYR